MATPVSLCSAKPTNPRTRNPTRLPPLTRFRSQIQNLSFHRNRIVLPILLGTGLAAVSLAVGPESAAATATELPILDFQLGEPANALSLPTWAVHVSSVVEWITAMVLVWQYGEVKGYESWKGLSWGMVPLLGGAMCACTWHFFYNAESLEVLVALQAALTVIGNATMCFAAFRINQKSEEIAKKP